jgi:methyltransferase family protein
VQFELLEQMSCPYCGAGFRIRRTVSSDKDRLRYGLVECRCFAFPVVDGVLLLSLAKGYGGAEEALQPYVPLQVAAVQYLERDDDAGLRAWIRRHVPFAADLIDGTDEPYLTFSSRLDHQLSREVGRFLGKYGEYEVLGYPRPRPRRFAADMVAPLRWRLRAPREPDLATTADYYASRYFSPRVNALALQLGALPTASRILSLCCGQGVFENLLRATHHPADVVSLDAQFLNLLITRRYADHGGSYICHDVQFPLPFRTGTFDGVFSSTCLPEIPGQWTLVSEAVRVTSDRGWTDFDSIWSTEMGAHRIDPQRYYRFCQNFFTSLDEYVPMFQACAGPHRRVGVDVPDAPAAYLTAPGWVFDSDVDTALADRADDEISVLVVGREFPGFVEPDRPWLSAGDHMAASLAFHVSRRDGRLELQRRPGFDTLHPVFAPRRFSGYPQTASIDLSRVGDSAYLTGLFTAAQVTLVPPAFSPDPSRMLTPADTATSPRTLVGRGTSDSSTPATGGEAPH